MSYRFLDIATTASVRAVREDMGSAQVWECFEGDRAPDNLTQHETDFIAARDHFYMASVSQSGWPYVQHRGGPRGFLTVLDAATLAFADYRGNRQYISVGNMRANALVALILMDYANRTRLKIFATVELLPVDAESDLSGRVLPQDYRARTERIVLLHVVAFDWNCPQHITQRFTEDEIIETMRDVNERLVGLEDENARLRGELALTRNGVANP
ncbi:pyridoxamine 5'-phosphate oxidase family protein [Maricaulis sp.]|uniref:pyridoxamine 5'-phosphate oxidase family protein n=1 Tax=Maricaulis sp. TaxID=1486257 RepID=UPI000C3F1D31|nr:pyridoxamine 5'-phosphate oxidase family protein [Maricaulis sp.]MAC90231.1 pyridoxamine 5-phosphate oxidase [Maricaulis sp.]